MTEPGPTMKFLPHSRAARWLIAILAPSVLTYGLYSLSQSAPATPPNITPVQLSADPLYAQGSGQKPTLTLALSVEFPTVGAQYRQNYDISTTYPGYFNPAMCYQYVNNVTTKHFAISGAATGNSCNGAGFSGNFMNWATGSAIDILRLGLTGGDRIEDTATSSILQRAVIPSNFYDNGSYFPQKNVANDIAKQSLPSSLFAANDTTGVRISNCLNKVHIFTNGIVPQYSGSDACDNPDILMGPILEQRNGTNRPSGYSDCAGESGTCSFTGYREMVFGTTTKWQRRLVKSGVNCDYRVLGDPAPNEGKRCYIKTTTLTFPADQNALAGDSFFYARAKVCNSSGGNLQDTRDMCQRYPNGNFKPVGNMQRYSDRLRLAAFGYLMDNSRSRYGGVLRAPMTYVGTTSYDANGNLVSGTNPYAEWDANTGVFNQNPRNASEGISGVINYLNRFGRTGTPGTYKGLDPISELYYESLRYLQGLQPTAGAVSNLTTANKDGYPVYSSWTDPFAGSSSTKSYACLRNSILTIGDKNTHSDKSLPGNTRTANEDYDRSSDVNVAADVPNFVDWTRVVGGFESNNSVTYTDGRGASRTTSNPTSTTNTALWGMENQDTGAGGTSAYYMAGAAYWAHTHDIRTAEDRRRPGMRVTTYVLDVNEGGASSDANTRRRTQLFLTAKYGGFSDPDNDGNPFTPANEQGAFNSRYWEKDTEPGEAKTYFLASDATAVLRALDGIFASAAKVSSTISAPAASTNTLSTSDGFYYTASFNPEYWSGDLKRNTIRISASGAVQLGNIQNAVSAAARLDQLTDAQTDNRNIIVGLEGSSSTGGTAAAFTWAAINDTLRSKLNKANPTATADNDGTNRLNFIRGYRAREGVSYRQRASRLGDIVNSGAAYSGAPTTRYNGISAYKTFYNANVNRTKAVFIGANDGMLHAFNADTMEELFAYIPSWLGTKLSQLSNSNYNSSGHTSYVDAQPVVAEAQVGSDWKTVLVSGTGGGGQGVFALDVSNPGSFAANKVLWEFTDQNDPDLGNVIGQPRIVKLRTSAPTATTPTYKWFAAVASGVNNYVNDGSDRFSTTGSPALFLLDLSKPSRDAWSLGTNYFKISLPISNDLTTGTQEVNTSGQGTGVGKATGLLNVNFTANSVDAVEFFYLGDLHGQFWKLDMSKANFSSSTNTSWNLAKVSGYVNSSSAPIPMYIAKDSAGKVQPITMVPTIAFGPSSGSYIVAFGTGKYLEARDNNIDSSTQTQSFYVLYDSGSSYTVDVQPDTGSLARFNGRARLQQGSITSGVISVPSFYWNVPRNTNDTDKKAGWFIDFPLGGSSGGERQITSATLFGQDILFTSLLPPSASTDACGGGSSYAYQANLASGQGTAVALSSGAQGAPMVFNTGSTLSGSDSVGSRTRTDRAVIVRPGATANEGVTISDTITTPPTDVGRLSWRQLNNYRELRNKTWD